VTEDPAGPERHRPSRALHWIVLTGTSVAAVGFALDGRPLLAGAFMVGGVSAALRQTRFAERSPGFRRAAEYGMAAGFALAALLVWLPLLTANGP
jgi:hypothetical protein